MKGFTGTKDQKRTDTFTGIRGTTINIQGGLEESILCDAMIMKVNTAEGDTRMMNIDLSPTSDTIVVNDTNITGWRLEKHRYGRF
jgi:hypothetical protein